MGRVATNGEGQSLRGCGGGSSCEKKEARKSEGECENDGAESGGWRFGEREREKYLAEQMKKCENDPMLLKCLKIHWERTTERRKSLQLPPIPVIQVFEPNGYAEEHTTENCQEKHSVSAHTPEHNNPKMEGEKQQNSSQSAYIPKDPLSAFSVHYWEIGCSSYRYWENYRKLREERLMFAINHRFNDRSHRNNSFSELSSHSTSLSMTQSTNPTVSSHRHKQLHGKAHSTPPKRTTSSHPNFSIPKRRPTTSCIKTLYNRRMWS